MPNDNQPLSAVEVLSETLVGVKTHTADGESVSDFSMQEKIEGLRELDRRQAAKNPLAAMGRYRTRMNSMQE